ncbi:GNAT family N-acetyltransferase [Enterococcus hailinensis]|uniref:GNAT family N-acetyltransferase n=1 Tax=Enterococcus hailinensis TaxID=3238988 RepID=UPI0038B345E8
MNFSFRQPRMQDLEHIMEIERSGFSPAEAASKEAMAERIQVISDSFLLAVNAEDQPVGYVVGPVIPERYLYDELFEKTVPNPPTNGYQTILSLAVAPDYQKFGIASALLTELAQHSRKVKRSGITLTCLKDLIPFYEKNGYHVEGVSKSQHAGEVWYDLVLDL